MEYRIFVGWGNGAYVNSLSGDFHKELNELIAQYGQPTTVELRNVWSEAVPGDNP